MRLTAEHSGSLFDQNALTRQHLNLSGKLQLRKVRRSPLTSLLPRVIGAAPAPLLHQRQRRRKQNGINNCNHHSWRWRRSPAAPTATDAGQRWKLGSSKRKAAPLRQAAVNTTQRSFEELWKAVEALPKKRWTILKREFDRVQSISNARIRDTDAKQAEQSEKAEREAWNQFGELCQKYGIPLQPRLIVILNRLR